MKNIFLFLLLSVSICFGQLRTVQYDPVTGNVVQENLSFPKIKNTSYPIHVRGKSTNITISWKTNYHIATPSNDFTVTFMDAPNESGIVKKITLELQNTNSTLGFFPSNSKELDGNNPVLGSAPSTNIYSFYYSNGKFWTESQQNYKTGSGTNVFNISPTLLDIRIPGSQAGSNYVWACTNEVTGQGEWRFKPRTGIWRTIAVPAGAMLTNLTDGAIFGTEESVSHFKRRDFMQFTNSTEQTICLSIPMPETWDKGNVEVKVYWSATNIVSSKSVVWGVSADTVEHDEPVDQAYGTEVLLTSAQTAFNDLIKTSSTGVLTLGHSVSQSGAILDLRVRRKGNHASDNMDGVAKIYFVIIRYLESPIEPLSADVW